MLASRTTSYKMWSKLSAVRKMWRKLDLNPRLIAWHVKIIHLYVVSKGVKSVPSLGSYNFNLEHVKEAKLYISTLFVAMLMLTSTASFHSGYYRPDSASCISTVSKLFICNLWLHKVRRGELRSWDLIQALLRPNQNICTQGGSDFVERSLKLSTSWSRNCFHPRLQ